MSKSKQKGTSAETAVVKYLNANGFPTAERRILKGSLDEGDITGIPDLVIEVKNQRVYKIPEWLRELEEEITNAGATFGFVIAKPNGVGMTSVGKWWAIMPLETLVLELRDAGWGDDR